MAFEGWPGSVPEDLKSRDPKVDLSGVGSLMGGTLDCAIALLLARPITRTNRATETSTSARDAALGIGRNDLP